MGCECPRRAWGFAAAGIAALLGLQIGLNARAFMAEVYATNGAAAREAGETATAAWSLEHAVSWAPFRPELGYELGMARCNTGDFEGARRALRLSLRGAPHSVHTLLAAARVEDKLGNPDAARQLVARARALLPRYWRVAAAAADIETNAGEPRKAVDELRAALNLPGVERGRVLSSLATAYAALGDTAQALSCAEEAATLLR